MKILPLEYMQIYVADGGTVLVGAHEHNGYIWWSRLPKPGAPDEEVKERGAGLARPTADAAYRW